MALAGNFFLLLSIISSFSAFSLELFTKKFTHFIKFFTILAHIFVISSFSSLLCLFIENDLSNVVVLMNSSTLMDLHYRISASWSSHETSLLFWNCIISLLSIIYMFQSKFQQRRTYQISLFVQLMLILILYFSSNPFLKINVMPTEGLGMNPSLQDFAMMIHPPMLYFAYSGYLIIFSIIVSSEFFDEKDIKYKKLWSRISLSLLTFAIGLGGWWAYRELGWGGYWYFDPVENISLLVWIFGVCYHHTMIQRGFEISKIYFGVAPFIAVIFGTFFVRSGLLISVHSFAETNTSIWFLVSFIILNIIASLALYSGYIKRKEILLNQNSKEKIINASNIIWMISAFIIILSLIYPAMMSVLFSQKIEVEANFFVSTLIPIFLVSTILMAFSYQLSKANVIIFASLSIIIPISTYHNSGVLIAFSYYIGFSIIFLSLIKLFIQIKNKYLNSSYVSMITSHFGAGLLIISIGANNHFGFSNEVDLEIGQIKKLYNYDVELKGISYGNGKNYLKQTAEIGITGDNFSIDLAPQLRFYPVEKSLSSEVDLVNFVSYDFYAVLSNILDDKITVNIMYHPAISFIWFSIFLMSFGIILKTLRRF